MANFYTPNPGLATARAPGRMRLCVVLLLALVCLPAAAWAQAPPAAQQPAAPVGSPFGDPEFRYQLVLLDQLSYDLHPFFQITGDPGYLSGKGASAFINDLGTRESDRDEDFVTRLLHALPPFGVEGVSTLELPFPKGLSYGLDYNVFSQADTDAARDAVSVTAIRTDTFIYSAVLRLFFFDPNQPGINYFVGFSLGFLQGNLIVPFTSGREDIIPYRQGFVGSTRLGLESRGEDVGFRYELTLLKADEVTLRNNPYPNAEASPTNVIDFSGSIVRVSIFIHFD